MPSPSQYQPPLQPMVPSQLPASEPPSSKEEECSSPLEQLSLVPKPEERDQQSSSCYCLDQIYLFQKTMKNVETQIMTCINSKCKQQFHKFCMKVYDKSASLRIAPLFECTTCVLIKLDPLH